MVDWSDDRIAALSDQDLKNLLVNAERKSVTEVIARCKAEMEKRDAAKPRTVYFNTGAHLQTIWLNGKRIYKSEGWTGWHAGKERVAAELNAGKNTIVIETGSAFFLSITEADKGGY